MLNVRFEFETMLLFQLTSLNEATSAPECPYNVRVKVSFMVYIAYILKY